MTYSLRRSAAFCGHEFRLLWRDGGALLQLLIIPGAMIIFLEPLFRAPGVSGAQQVVPGLSVVFALFLIGYIGFGVFREHGFGTWERLRASPASPLEIMVAKVVPSIVVALVQQVALFAAGFVLLDLVVAGSLLGLVAVGVALSLCLVAFGILCAAWLRSSQQLNALSGVAAMLLGGLGGGFAPVAMLPAWVQAVAPLTPGYWAVRGYRDVIVDGAGLAGVLLPVGILLAFAVGATALALRRFRIDETKIYAG
jgi:ABC-2 type transport system permease protein